MSKTVNTQLVPAQRQLLAETDALHQELTHIRFAAARGDIKAAFAAINAAARHAKAIRGINKQLVAVLDSALTALQEEKAWTDELLRRIEAIDPDILSLAMEATSVEVAYNEEA